MYAVGGGGRVGGVKEEAVAGSWGALGNHTLYASTSTHRLTWALADRTLHFLIQAANQLTGTSKRGKRKRLRFYPRRTYNLVEIEVIQLNTTLKNVMQKIRTFISLF